MKNLVLFCLTAVLSVAATADPEEDCGCDGETAQSLIGAEPDLASRIAAADGTVRLELFVMSLCPYGMEAEARLWPLADRFGERVDLQLYFIADEVDAAAKTTSAEPLPKATAGPARPGCAAAASRGDGPFASLHGQAEIDEGRRQLIVAADHPDALGPYLLCRAQKRGEGDWEDCLAAVGLDAAAVQAAAIGTRGEALFRQNIRRANQLGIDLSPTLLIDGQEYEGPFEPQALARAVCADGNDATVCDEVPVCGRDDDCAARDGAVALCVDPDGPTARCQYRKPVSFGLTVLEDSACRRCDTESFLQTTRTLFPGARIQRLAAQSAAAQDSAARYGIKVFPAYLFDGDFAATARFGRIRHLVEAKNGGFVLKRRLASGSYWPSRPLQQGRLDVFMPSWARQAEADLIALWPGAEADMRLHYLPVVGAVDQEWLRRACLTEHFPERFPAYVRAVAGAADWASAAAAAGVDTTALKTCSAGPGQALVRRTAALADSLELAPDALSVLFDNRTLLRQVQVLELARFWQKGSVE